MKKLSHEELLGRRISVEDSRSIERFPVTLMVDNVRSLYNVGSLFRTADAALAAQLVLCGYTPHPPRPEIEKTALGAVDTVPWKYERDILAAIAEQKGMGKRIVAVELTDSGRSYDSLERSDFPLCLIVGNELTGIDSEVLQHCDDAVEIPMHGVKHSLNVSVAAGIVLFEAVRIWKSLPKD